jgi:putative inorganic carbon (HCO3(-)) transporter
MTEATNGRGMVRNGAIPPYPTSSPWVLGLFGLFVISVYLQAGYRFPVLGAMRSEFLLGAVLGVCAVMAKQGQPSTSAGPLRPLVGVLLALLLLMVPMSHVPQLSWDVLVDRVFKFALIALFITAFVRSPSGLRWFLGVFLFACLKMCEEGLIGTIDGSLIWENQGIPRLHGATPNYEHPNSFAGMALGTLPFVVYLYPVVPRWARWVLAVQAALALNVVLRTGSRTGYVALVAFIFVAIWRSERRIRTFLIVSVVCAAAIPFIPQEYKERATSVVTMQEKEGKSSEARKEILADAWQILKEHPLGVGVGAFPAVRFERFGRSQDTHNLYFEVATNIGVHGLIVFLAFVGLVLRKLDQSRRDFARQRLALQALVRARAPRSGGGEIEKHLRDICLLEAACAATFMFIITRLALGLFGMDFYEVYWWFALGLCLAILNMRVTADARTQRWLELLDVSKMRQTS